MRVFKCGPDFLDPHWHELASGAPVHSVDLWMTGESDMLARLHAAACEADLILVEGVMGLFDGTPCAADVAERLGLPVLAVIDASGMAGTFGALAHGRSTIGRTQLGQPAGQPRGQRPHTDLLRAGRRAIPRCGWARWRRAESAASLLPERHLGLVAMNWTMRWCAWTWPPTRCRPRR